MGYRQHRLIIVEFPHVGSSQMNGKPNNENPYEVELEFVLNRLINDMSRVVLVAVIIKHKSNNEVITTEDLT